MIPHKTKRGAAALARLKVYEGVPTPITGRRESLKVLRLTAGHKYRLLGQLSSEVGWNHYETIKVDEFVTKFASWVPPFVKQVSTKKMCLQRSRVLVWWQLLSGLQKMHTP